MKGTELQHTVAVHFANHTSMHRQDFQRWKNTEDLYGTSGMSFSLIGSGAMCGQNSNSQSTVSRLQFIKEDSMHSFCQESVQHCSFIQQKIREKVPHHISKCSLETETSFMLWNQHFCGKKFFFLPGFHITDAIKKQRYFSSRKAHSHKCSV